MHSNATATSVDAWQLVLSARLGDYAAHPLHVNQDRLAGAKKTIHLFAEKADSCHQRVDRVFFGTRETGLFLPLTLWASFIDPQSATADPPAGAISASAVLYCSRSQTLI